MMSKTCLGSDVIHSVHSPLVSPEVSLPVLGDVVLPQHHLYVVNVFSFHAVGRCEDPGAEKVLSNFVLSEDN